MDEKQTNNYEPDLQSDVDLEDVEFHRPPHPLAIATVIVGLFSFLALFKTSLWLIPIITVGLGVACLISLKINPEKLGRKAVFVGLALAILFGSWAMGRHFSRQQWLCGYARKHADTWFTYVQDNRLREAHQLHLHHDQRVQEGVSIEDFYANQMYAQEDYDGFFHGEPLEEFTKVAADSEIEYAGLDEYAPGRITDDLVLRYVARYEAGKETQTMTMLVTMRRSVNPMTGECGWAVLDVMPGDDQ